MPPNFDTVRSTQAAIWASSARSVFKNRTSWPSELATAFPPCSSMSAIATFVPSRWKARTTAAPIMVAPPVTMATFPFSPSMLVSWLRNSVLAEESYHGAGRGTRATVSFEVAVLRNEAIRASAICLGDLTHRLYLGTWYEGFSENRVPGANSMRKIAIVGGGQSGLQLALGLPQKDYGVTVVSNRTPEQILSGRVTSSQFMFHDSLQNERDLGINFWEKECPVTEGIAFTIPGPEKTKALFWEAKLDGYGQSIDQRVKFAGWMKEFAKRGGNLVIKDAGPEDVDGYSKSHDLVLVAAGKGEINRMFERDAEKSPYDQ